MKEHKIGASERAMSFALYGGLGVSTEVFFTAVVDLINAATVDDLSLKGQSYIWMFPITDSPERYQYVNRLRF